MKLHLISIATLDLSIKRFLMSGVPCAGVNGEKAVARIHPIKMAISKSHSEVVGMCCKGVSEKQKHSNAKCSIKCR